MPAKITLNTTDRTTGEISIADVSKVVNDYKTLVSITCSDTQRIPGAKYTTFDIDMNKLQAILANSPNADPQRFRIHLTLNLPGQLSCDGAESIENRLSILICAVGGAYQPGASLLNENDYVLVDGFKENSSVGVGKAATRAGVASGTCCVQGGRG